MTEVEEPGHLIRHSLLGFESCLLWCIVENTDCFMEDDGEGDGDADTDDGEFSDGDGTNDALSSEPQRESNS